MLKHTRREQKHTKRNGMNKWKEEGRKENEGNKDRDNAGT
jgi:hypothetical protein